MSKHTLKAVVAAVACAGAIAAVGAFGVGAANADPTRTYNGVGSNTTQDVFNAFTTSSSAAGTGLSVASWNATPPGTSTVGDHIQTVFGGDSFERPDGSGDGRAALSAAYNTTNTWTSSTTGLVQTLGGTSVAKASEISFARSSSLPGSATTSASGAKLTYFPEAEDAVGTAELTNSSGTAVGDFSTAQLAAIYGGTNFQPAGAHTWNAGAIDSTDFATPVYVFTPTNSTPVVNGTSAEYVYPVVPESSSGTRSFFLSAIGVSTLGSGVVNEATEEENNLQALTPTTIHTQVPAITVDAHSISLLLFSGASAIAQQHGVAADTGLSLAGLSWPTTNTLSLFTSSGATAAVGTLASSETPVRPGTSTVGDFGRYVFAVLPSSVAVQNTTPGTPGAEGTLQVWLDQTLAAAPNLAIWTNYGFLNVAAGFTDNDSNWDYSPFTN